jgi:hypothetical protein
VVNSDLDRPAGWGLRGMWLDFSPNIGVGVRWAIKYSNTWLAQVDGAHGGRRMHVIAIGRFPMRSHNLPRHQITICTA